MKYSAPQYAKALHELVNDASGSEHRKVIREFLTFVSKHGALSQLPDIVVEFERVSERAAGVHSVVIRSPDRLAEADVARRLPFKARVQALLDARLGGGAVVEVDDLRIDNSVAMRMERLRDALTK